MSRRCPRLAELLLPRRFVSAFWYSNESKWVSTRRGLANCFRIFSPIPHFLFYLFMLFLCWLVAAVAAASWLAYFMNQVAGSSVCEMRDVCLIYMWMRTRSHLPLFATLLPCRFYPPNTPCIHPFIDGSNTQCPNILHIFLFAFQ